MVCVVHAVVFTYEHPQEPENGNRSTQELSCKGKCESFRAKKTDIRESLYGQGKKYCVTCGLFITWNGVYCPCCNYKMRVKPRKKNNDIKSRIYVK